MRRYYEATDYPENGPPAEANDDIPDRTGHLLRLADRGDRPIVDETACIRCALCIIRCPTDAITMNRYGAVIPSVGRALPKESLDDEIHLDLTVGSRKSIRPLPMYDPVLAAGLKDVPANGHGANGHSTQRERDLIAHEKH